MPIVLPVSCATGFGVDQLVAALARWVPEVPADGDEEGDELPSFMVYRPGVRVGVGVRVVREDGAVRLYGAPIEEAVRAADDAVAEELLGDYVERAGLRGVLQRAGARKGVVVRVGDRAIPYRVG